MKSSKRILHVINDEKFIEDADKLFNRVVSYEHSYIIIGKRKKLQNLKSLEVYFIHPVNLILGYNLNFINKYDAIIFHGLKGFKFNLIKKIKKEIPIGWIGWGFDYYSLINSDRSDFLLPETFSIGRSLSKKKRSFSKLFLKSFEPSVKTKLDLLKRIKFFNTVVKEDHYILKKAIGDIIPKYFDWNYPILKESLINSYFSTEFNGNNILIGNSNSVTNNHLDAFKFIKSSEFSDYDEIICPLSYGGSKEYKNLVIQKGEEIFSDKFKPLIDFYKPKEYFDILNSCGYYFSPTIRQQAFGNILLMLYVGASVILFRENPVYRSLLEKGLIIFSENELQCGFVRKLTLNEIESNRRIVLENFSEKILLLKSEKFLNNLIG